MDDISELVEKTSPQEEASGSDGDEKPTVSVVVIVLSQAQNSGQKILVLKLEEDPAASKDDGRIDSDESEPKGDTENLQP